MVGEASTAAEALARVPAAQVAVLDVRLPDADGVTTCRELRSRMPELACLMLTSFSDGEALFDAILVSQLKTSPAGRRGAAAPLESGGHAPDVSGARPRGAR